MTASGPWAVVTGASSGIGRAFAPGRVVLRRRFVSVGLFGGTRKNGALSRLISSALELAARSLLDARQPLLEEASSSNVQDLSKLFGLVTCRADATRLGDGKVSVTALVTDERVRVFGRGEAVFRCGRSAVADRWAAEWWER